MNAPSLKSILLASALVVPALAVNSASAQQKDLSENCQALVDRLAQADGTIRVNDTPRDVNVLQRLAEANKDSDCKVVVENMEISAQGTQSAQGARSSDQDRMQTAQGNRSSDQEKMEMRESESVTKRISIEEEARLRGMAVVEVPKPDVSIDQPGVEVDVTAAAPEVQVTEQQAQILVRQPQQTIRLEMPAPTITISQPAPEIIITMPPPGVDVASADPQVEVRMPDPKVEVTQGKPELRFNLQTAGAAQQADETQAQSDNRQALAGNASANVQTRKGTPVVTMGEGEAKPRINVSRAEPEVRYEATQPTVEVSSAGEPQINIEQSGEPKVTFQESQRAQNSRQTDQNNRQQARNSQQQNDQMNRQGDQRNRMSDSGSDQTRTGANMAMTDDQKTNDQMASDRRTNDQMASDQRTNDQTANDQRTNDQMASDRTMSAGQAMSDNQGQNDESRQAAQRERSEKEIEYRNRMISRDGDAPLGEGVNQTFMVRDLDDVDVVNARGEELGEIEKIVRMQNTDYVIIEHGGFLGIGDSETAVPLDRLTRLGGEFVLRGMTEEELDRMPTFDDADGVELGRDESVQVNVQG